MGFPLTSAPEAAQTDDVAAVGDENWLPSWTARLNRALSGPSCVLGWLASIALFVVIYAVTGPAVSDTHETLYSTWAIAHGQVACAYPGGSDGGQPPAAPLYPLLSGGIAALTQIGHSVPFPSASAVGPSCSDHLAAIDRWSTSSGALHPTLWIGCTGWLALMAGVIAWLRASGRGRCWWEPATLLLVAGLVPVWFCVQTVFHPQDLFALGLALAAAACARRQNWVVAGILLGLAILSQQFALLVAVPLLVVAPGAKKVRLALATFLTGAIVVLPLTALTDGHVIRAVTLGTGDNPAEGGTVLWETGANGVAAVLLFRIAPLVLSVLLSWWAVRRLGRRALEPVPLMSLLAVSLGLRLVFEANLFTYYFMALAVTLALLEVCRGSIRRTVAAWFAALTLVGIRMGGVIFGPAHWQQVLQHRGIPIVFGGAALLAILFQLARGDNRRNMAPWVAVVVIDLILLPGGNALSQARVIWFWQIVLVVPGMLLAAQPLRNAVRSFGKPDPTEPVAPGPSSHREDTRRRHSVGLIGPTAIGHFLDAAH